ncbi:MAG: Ig-like domain-containing protein [Chitinivibrionia bacterium]|nr:Ig-like domain-containing protein [Chitinivibrionia bacterium]
MEYPLLIDINQPPVFVIVCYDTTISEGDPYSCEITMIDPANPVGYSTSLDFNHQPVGAILNSTGPSTWSLEFTPDYTQVDSSFTVALTGDDSFRQVSHSFMISVINRPLSVASIDPVAVQRDLLTSEQIAITFNEAVDPATVPTGIIATSSRGLTLRRTYDAEQYVVVVDHTSGALAPLDTLAVTINSNLLDLAGKPFSPALQFSLRTGADVYPGDANNDGVVDERDLLPMGRYWGNQGPPRSETPDLQFVKSPAHVRAGLYSWSPYNVVYADADGNGQVEANDICGLGQNWLLTHSAAKQETAEAAQAVEEIETSVRQQMLAAAIECPESGGVQRLRDLLGASLGVTVDPMPDRIELYGNYPNPFNPSTTISFFLPDAALVHLEIFNLLGQSVSTLVDGRMNSGHHEVVWDGLDRSGGSAASGVYVYRLQCDKDNFTTRRMILLK